MEFISEQGTYNCDELKNPELYSAFINQFEEAIDVTLCRMMIEDNTVVPVTVEVPKVDKKSVRSILTRILMN